MSCAAVVGAEGEAVGAVGILVRAVGPVAVGVDGGRAVRRVAGLAVRQAVALGVRALDRPALVRVLGAGARVGEQTGASLTASTVIDMATVAEMPECRR